MAAGAAGRVVLAGGGCRGNPRAAGGPAAGPLLGAPCGTRAHNPKKKLCGEKQQAESQGGAACKEIGFASQKQRACCEEQVCVRAAGCCCCERTRGQCPLLLQAHAAQKGHERHESGTGANGRTYHKCVSRFFVVHLAAKRPCVPLSQGSSSSPSAAGRDSACARPVLHMHAAQHYQAAAFLRRPGSCSIAHTQAHAPSRTLCTHGAVTALRHEPGATRGPAAWTRVGRVEASSGIFVTRAQVAHWQPALWRPAACVCDEHARTRTQEKPRSAPASPGAAPVPGCCRRASRPRPRQATQ